MKRFCLKLLSSSSWGCELKYNYVAVNALKELSSSSWGCELKCICCHCLSRSVRHPLHEDVSWNRSDSSRQVHDLRHPLHEDVSWNDHGWIQDVSCYRHPLHEDVSWNVFLLDAFLIASVILFMRMWVEIILIVLRVLCSRSHPLYEDVSWNMNLTTGIGYDNSHPLHEDVSWNDSKVQHGTVLSGHPLHEDVSWNLKMQTSDGYDVSHPLREDVSWNSICGF